MVGYPTCSQAVVSRVLEHFSDILNENRCKHSDIDSVFLSMIEEDATYGCVLDYRDGSLRSRSPFKEDVWIWEIVGVFFVRYRGDQELVDQQAVEVIDRLSKLFYLPEHKRLGGVVPMAVVRHITQPEAEQINDVPFYWIPFMIEVIDK